MKEIIPLTVLSSRCVPPEQGHYKTKGGINVNTKDLTSV